MSVLARPLILVHGLWDTPKVFNRLILRCSQSDKRILSPFLEHRSGLTSLRTLAKQLDFIITEEFGSNEKIDLLGFSMGGLISRIWLQEMHGYLRTKRFFTIGSPHNGTLMASLIPFTFAGGIADMKINSPLLNDLNADYRCLNNLSCYSFYCNFDMMVFPGWKAVMPIGLRIPLPVLTHRQLILNQKSLSIISKTIYGIN